MQCFILDLIDIEQWGRKRGDKDRRDRDRGAGTGGQEQGDRGGYVLTAPLTFHNFDLIDIGKLAMNLLEITTQGKLLFSNNCFPIFITGPPPPPNITSCEMLLMTSSYSIYIYNITWEQEDISNEDIAYHEIITNQTDPFNSTKIYPGVNSAIIRICGGHNNSITVKVVDKCEQTNEDNISLTCKINTTTIIIISTLKTDTCILYSF